MHQASSMTAAFCRLPPPLRSSSFRREQVQSSICSRHACVPSAVWKRAKRSANEKPARPRHVPKKRRADIARTPSRPSLSLGDAERLHKVLSRLGVASRRGAEALIGQSRVRVNGRVIQEQGMLVNARKDRIEVDGGVVTIADSAVWMVVHKMRGSVCVPRGGGGRWVGSFLCDGSLVCVDGIEGRATGVVVLTNERGVVGDFASRGGELVREWIVDCGGVLDQGVLKRVVDGVKLEGEAELGKFSDVKVIGCGIIDVGGEDGKCMVTRLEIRVRDCRRRIVSRVLEACDVKVLRLCRRTFGPVLLGNLKRGDSRKMTAKEIRALKRGVGRGR